MLKKMHLQLVIILCLSMYDVVFSKRSRIVGGINTNIKRYPYTVSIRLPETRLLVCAGAIITEQHILTAAHCFDNIQLHKFSVYVGSSYSTNYTIPHHKICNIHIYPGYDAKKEMAMKSRFDIAVAVIVPKITFTELQSVIKLPKKDAKVGSVGVITGWGRKSYPNGELSDVIQMASMTIVKNSECQKYVPFPLHSEQVCAFQQKGVGACYGDSGAPLVIDGKVVGISSFVRPCALGEPDIYIRVYAYVDFIKESSNCGSSSCCSLYSL